MSTGPTTPQGEAHDVEAGSGAMREPVRFPRLELPTVPTFRAPLTPSDELPVQHPLVDEPATTWQSPFPTPEPTNAYTFQVMPPPPPPIASMPVHPEPAPVPVPPTVPVPVPVPAAPAPAPVRASVPAMAPTTVSTQPGEAASGDAPTNVSMVAMVLLAVLMVGLLWASRMAFSPALLAMSALLASELAIGRALTGPRGASRPASATIAAGGGVVLALLALKGAFGGFSEMAFVASLFVLVAALPTLLVLAAVEVVLRRRRTPSAADTALRAGTKVRFAAVLALLVSGYLAKDSFSAKPDTFAAFGIVALVALNVVSVLRGSGRAARA